MKDEMFGLYDKCPKCGRKKLYYAMQYPLEVMKALNGKVFIRINGKRKYELSNRDMAWRFKLSLNDFQCANCVCENCGWMSETITQ